MAVYETILNRIKRKNAQGKGSSSGYRGLGAVETTAGKDYRGLGVVADTSSNGNGILMAKGGKVLGYTERWKKARGG